MYGLVCLGVLLVRPVSRAPRLESSGRGMSHLPPLFYIIISTRVRAENTSELCFRFIWKNQTETFNSSAELRIKVGQSSFCSLNIKESGRKALLISRISERQRQKHSEHSEWGSYRIKHERNKSKARVLGFCEWKITACTFLSQDMFIVPGKPACWIAL